MVVTLYHQLGLKHVSTANFKKSKVGTEIPTEKIEFVNVERSCTLTGNQLYCQKFLTE